MQSAGFGRFILGALLAVGALLGGRISRTATRATISQSSGCALPGQNGAIQHVIYLQFDNVHLTRDNPNVPSDLEQMPNLLNFLEQNGALLANQHTPLIAHTANDFVTAITGLYPDRQGLAVSNSYRTYGRDGSSRSASAFGYWINPASATDPSPNLLSAPNTTAPAPWVPYTRAGCDVGFAGIANTVLESAKPDVATVFGADSPEAGEAQSDGNRAYADYVGVAVHCAQSSDLCSAENHGVPDLLPDEPHGYNGFNALFGQKYIAPLISPNEPLPALDGRPIVDPKSGAPGFPGFDGLSPAVSLAYVAAMQEHGIPITYAYLSDAHDNHATGEAFGPGEAGYVAQLRADDAAFGTFFQRLQNDGITAANTLFVVTADEGDHFAGGQPSPANCDGVTTPCSYSQIGEIDGNLTGLLATQQNVTAGFAVHADTAPAFYLDGNPGQNDAITRQVERAVAALHGLDPISGQDTPLTYLLADQAEMALLHMVTPDPARTPTFVMFAQPDFFLSTGAANCNKPCLFENPTAAWEHGAIDPAINTTWLGLVGPGVQQLGRTDTIWSSQTDIRPTMLALLGLRDDYAHEGRVLIEALTDSTLPPAAGAGREAYTALAAMYEQIDAPLGALAQQTLRAATAALASADADDATFTSFETQIAALTQQRDALAARMSALLDADENDLATGSADSPTDLVAQGQALLNSAQQLAATVASGTP